ncbi:hypothetical protein ACFWA5_37190 [Streptomyces mirabilis]|uniref:hypothetical protein n=1 Tax=Streptomyces mirabilis TaxID=68239 RepID=UPI003650C821
MALAESSEDKPARPGRPNVSAAESEEMARLLQILNRWIVSSGLTRQQVFERLVPEHFGDDDKIPSRTSYYAQLQGKKLRRALVIAVEDICFQIPDAARRQPALDLLKAAQETPTPRSPETARMLNDLEKKLAAKNEEIIAAQGRHIEVLEEHRRLREAYTRSDALLGDSQQLVAGLLWASSELEREIVQCKRERAALRVVAGPDATALAEARARIQELEQAKEELAQQLAQAQRDRDAALALNEELMQSLYQAGHDETSPGFDVAFTFEDLWTSDPLGRDRGPTDVHTVLNRTRKMMYDLSEQRSALRRSAAEFSTDNPGAGDSDEKSRQATEMELYARAMSTGATSDIAAWISGLRGSDQTEEAINSRLVLFAQRGSEKVGGFAHFLDLAEGVNRHSPGAGEQLLTAAGAYREIGELRTHLRRHADTPIGECFLRGMALSRPPKDLAHALRFLRKGTMSIQEDRALAERVVRTLAEFGTDERVSDVLDHLTRADAATIRQFRQHRKAASQTARQTDQSPAPAASGRIITGTVVTHSDARAEPPLGE